MATFTVIIATILICNFTELECVKYSSLDKTYNKGVQAYSKERWSECIVQFEESLHLYKTYTSILINCRLKCKLKKEKPLISENIDDLKIFELFIDRNICFTNCHTSEFEKVSLYHNVSESVLTNIQLKKPYEYLHICYFQMNSLPKAASASFTYLTANPNDEAMKKNFEYYVLQPEVDINEVKNLEMKDYETLYQLGLNAYKLNDWKDTVANFEKTITDYFIWENSCRVECENIPEQEWSSEFTTSFAYGIVSLLTCSQSCQNQLKPQYQSGNEFLADVLNYLQISYYHMDNLEKAAESVASYLILLPTDEDMLVNKKIYRTLVDDKKFSERSDIRYYYKRDLYEKQLLNLYINSNNKLVLQFK